MPLLPDLKIHTTIFALKLIGKYLMQEEHLNKMNSDNLNTIFQNIYGILPDPALFLTSGEINF